MNLVEFKFNLWLIYICIYQLFRIVGTHTGRLADINAIFTGRRGMSYFRMDFISAQLYGYALVPLEFPTVFVNIADTICIK